jgi:hypothetical protein
LVEGAWPDAKSFASISIGVTQPGGVWNSSLGEFGGRRIGI